MKKGGILDVKKLSQWLLRSLYSKVILRFVYTSIQQIQKIISLMNKHHRFKQCAFGKANGKNHKSFWTAKGFLRNIFVKNKVSFDILKSYFHCHFNIIKKHLRSDESEHIKRGCILLIIKYL